MAENTDRGSLGPLETALDHAHATMIGAGETEAARRAFFAALAAAELILVLEAELAEGSDRVKPMIAETEEGRFVLAFDTDARMAAFVGEAATATLSGRALAGMLAPAGLGLGLNLEVAPASILLPAEAMTWLVDLAPPQAELRECQVVRLDPPQEVDPVLLGLLDTRLAALAGMAEGACLAQVGYADGGAGLALALTGVPEAARGAVTQSFAEARTLAGLPDAARDVVFLEPDAPVWARFQRAGLRFEMPEAAAAEPPPTDPGRPPILR